MLIGTSGEQAHTKVLQDLFRNTLSKVPSDFGKLVYLTSLRDANSGLYHHYGLETVYSPEQSDRALRQSHIELFYDWLRKPLAEQQEDLQHYFRTVEGELGTILENWKTLEPYRGYIPLEADAAGRELFIEDLGLLVDLMLSELFPPVPPSVA